MAARLPLVQVAGEMAELPAGDFLSIADDVITVMNLLGNTYKAETLGCSLPFAVAQSAFTDGQARFVPVLLKRGATITGVKYFQRVQGAFTADAENRVGLYTISGGTLTLVASSTNDSSLWKASSNTFVSVPFSSSYNAAAGLYFIGSIYNSSAQTTAPSLASTAGLANAAMAAPDLSNSVKLYSAVNASTLPSSQAMSGLTAFNTAIWMALY